MTEKKKSTAKKSMWTSRSAMRRKNRKWLEYSSQIARRVAAALEDKNDLNQTKLAERLDVSHQYVSKVMKGQENLSLETIAKLSDALDVELISFPPYKDSIHPSFPVLTANTVSVGSGWDFEGVGSWHATHMTGSTVLATTIEGRIEGVIGSIMLIGSKLETGKKHNIWPV